MKLLKRTVSDKLLAKVNNIDTGGFALKTRHFADKLKLENKIPNASELVKNLDYNATVTDIESKISSISDLATNSAMTAVKNDMPDVGSLVEKTDCNTKISEAENNLPDHNHDSVNVINRVMLENI